MKTFIIFVLLTINISAQTTFNKFPMEIGNKWYFSWTPTIDNSIRTVLESVKDTMFFDGKIYKQIDRFDKTDSGWTRTIGEFYLRSENNVLYNSPGDTLLNYHWNDNTTSSELPLGIMNIHIDEENLFNKMRLTYFCYIFDPYQYYSFTDSIGFNTLFALEWRDWGEDSRYLIGCQIKDKVYGEILTDINDKKTIINNFYLMQNYPNPFNSTTIIEYSILNKSELVLELYDILGNKIKTLERGFKSEGKYLYNLDMSESPSGIYFYSLNNKTLSISKKLIYLK